MTASAPILAATDVQFAYRGDQRVLRGVCFAAETGQLRCLLGPNGSGKTTLLRCLLGQLHPAAGGVELDGEPIARYRPRRRAKRMSYVPQFPASAFAFTAGELVLMGRLPHTGMLGLATPADRGVAAAAMEMTETTPLAGRPFAELSGGEKQRVMIARALAQQPRVLLLDEPTSHLDLRNQVLIHELMRRVAHDWPMAVVCVSHDVNLAGRYADELTLMRDGQVVAAGPPATVLTAERMQETYHVAVDIIARPGSDVPLVFPQ